MQPHEILDLADEQGLLLGGENLEPLEPLDERDLEPLLAQAREVAAREQRAWMMDFALENMELIEVDGREEFVPR